MCIVLSLGKYKPGQIRWINYCRLYLNVVSIADITNARGNMIDPSMYAVNREAINTASRWQHVHQGKPDKSSWKLWQQVCKLFRTKIRHRQYLYHPLGSWIVNPTNMRGDWQFWHDYQQDLLYYRTSYGAIC